MALFQQNNGIFLSLMMMMMMKWFIALLNLICLAKCSQSIEQSVLTPLVPSNFYSVIGNEKVALGKFDVHRKCCLEIYQFIYKQLIYKYK
jgi:hypothetical protein